LAERAFHANNRVGRVQRDRKGERDEIGAASASRMKPATPRSAATHHACPGRTCIVRPRVATNCIRPGRSH
jgi:hypothetical protein